MGAEETATGTLAAVAADQVGRAADLLAGDREDLGVGPAPGLGLGPAGERLQGPVHGRDPPERVGQQHPVGDGVEHRPGLAGRPLRLLQAQGRLHGAGDLVAGQPQQGLLLAVQPVALGPAQGEQAEEPAPGQQRDQGQGADPQPGHQVPQDRGPAGHLVQVGHAHDLAGAQALQGQDLADLDVGLDDVVGHAGVGEPGPGPQVKVADGAGGPRRALVAPTSGWRPARATSASRWRLVAPTTWADRCRRRSRASMRPARRRRIVSRSLATAPSSFSTPG
jgi:hypothetical protein